MTATGYQNLLGNQALISHQVERLDTASMAARAGEHAGQAQASAELAASKAKLFSSAAELSVQVLCCPHSTTSLHSSAGSSVGSNQCTCV